MEVKSYYQKNKIINVDLKNIIPDVFIPKNPFSEEQILTAAAKIKKFGVCLPICIRKDIKDKERYFVFSGLKDFFALKYLGAKKIPAIIFSHTLPEAVIFYLLTEDVKDMFKKAELFKFLLQKGNYTVKELCDIFKFSPRFLNLLLLPLSLSKKEKEFFLLKNFSLNFLSEFTALDPEKKEDVMNSIIAKELSEKESFIFLKELSEKKEKPRKAAFLKNDTIIMNSMERLSKNLEAFGIFSEIEREEKDNLFLYKLILKNNPNQLCFDFENLLKEKL